MKIEIPCRTEILVFLLMFPIIKPESLRELFPFVETVFDVGRLVSVITICLIQLSTCNYRKIRINISFLVLCVLEGWIIVTTAYNNPGRLIASIINGSAVIAVVMITAYYAKRNPSALVRALLFNFEWIIYLNLFTMLVFPEGIYLTRNHPCYFLGLKNVFMIYMLPALAVAFLYLQFVKKSLRPIILIIAILISVIIGWCGTSIVGLITFIVVLFASHLPIVGKQFSLSRIWIFTLVIDILITVGRVLDSFGPIRGFIVNILHKNVTMSGRTLVWDEFWKLFKESPIIGFGYGTKITTSFGVVNHAHNAYFQYLLISGLIGLVLFMAYNIFVIRSYNKSQIDGNIDILMKSLMATLYMTFISEACNYALLFSIFTLLNCISDFVFASNSNLREESPYC